MVIALVQHFFNEEGQRLFPEWLRRIAGEARHYDGFVSLRQLSVPDDPTACFMLLEFADAERLRAWVGSPERQVLLAEQAPYRLRELQSQRFVAGPPIE